VAAPAEAPGLPNVAAAPAPALVEAPGGLDCPAAAGGAVRVASVAGQEIVRVISG
jgi:hypothetical protein